MELVAVMAAAILVFRQDVLLSATSPEDVYLVLDDFSELRTVPARRLA